ncbi:TonB-dependent receptor [Rhodanobacter sp. B05]|nr:TonB-dependent receptor [Rhodanobacter sp. B05]
MVYSPELVGGKTAPTISGQQTWREALQKLLAGSGLEWGFVNDTTVVIRQSGNAAKPAKTKPAASAHKQAETPGQKFEPTTLQSVTVTGTRIRGGYTASPTVTIDAKQIQEEGFTDLGEVIRSVPQNFSGGENPGVPAGNLIGSLINQNVIGGSALNLRGLGPDATLTLLNGRRMAYGGFSQAVDINAIPVEAVDRVDIVPDGASAIYGSDAVGGVGNVILKRDFDGVTVGTRYGGATDGGLVTRNYNATAGTRWSTGGLIATWMKTSTDPIYAADRSYTDYLSDPRTIYPGSDLRSGLLSVHQSLGDHVELHLDALRTEREQDNYFYVRSTPPYSHIATDTTTTLVSPSVEFFMPNDWTLTVGGTWGKSKAHSVETNVDLATGLITLVPGQDYCMCNVSRGYEVGAEGPLFALPGGDARLAVGAGYRYDKYWQLDYSTRTDTIQGDQSSRFAYAELNLPLIGSDQNITGVRRLALTAAVRGENYDSFGRVTTPKLGLIYDPSADFTTKASWGRSFKAPTLYQRYSAQNAPLLPAAALGGTGQATDATAFYLSGGDPDLKPERARTWSASLAFHPEMLPSLESELTWFHIDYTNRVVQPINTSGSIIGNPANAQFIDFSPTAAEQANILTTAKFYNYTGTAYDPSKVFAIVDNRYANVAWQQIKGLDLSASYRFDLGGDWLAIRGSVSWLNSTQQSSAAQRIFDLAGTLSNPAKVNSRIGAVWNSGGFSAAVFGNYKSGVTNNTVDDKKSASFTTFDATLRYAIGPRGGAWAGLEFALSAENLFNRAPPFTTPTSSIYSLPYDPTNYSAIGRYLSLSVSKHFF